jgi:hypothetical protein
MESVGAHKAGLAKVSNIDVHCLNNPMVIGWLVILWKVLIVDGESRLHIRKLTADMLYTAYKLFTISLGMGLIILHCKKSILWNMSQFLGLEQIFWQELRNGKRIWAFEGDCQEDL